MHSLLSHRWAEIAFGLIGLLLSRTPSTATSSSSLQSAVSRSTRSSVKHLQQNHILYDDETETETSPPMIQTIAQEAAADAKKKYEDLFNDYTEAGCLESWRPFPTIDAIAIPMTSKIILGKADGNGMVCMCGMLYDLAVTSAKLLRFLVTGDVSVSDSDSSSDGDDIDRDSGIAGGPPNFDSDPPSHPTAITPLDAWVMAKTSHRQDVIPCVDGRAAGYPCNKVDLVAKLSPQDFEIPSTGEAVTKCSDVWGWTYHSPDGGGNHREFVVWGVLEGHFFFEVTGIGVQGSSTNPKLLGFLPSTTGKKSLWHDVKMIGDFAYLGAEIGDHGMQIFDMTRLLTIDNCENDRYCRVLEWDGVYTGTSRFPLSNTHNVVVNNDNDNDASSNNRDYAYMVGGGNGCGGGLHIVDVTNPFQPTFVACFGDAGYVHDAQCVNYKGPDTNYNNENSPSVTEICVCFAESKVAIVDVTDKSNIRILSETVYNSVGYVHQGWLSSDHRYVVFGDETDEAARSVERTRTLVFNIDSLESPGVVQEFLGSTKAIDHNQYVAKIDKSTRKIDFDKNSKYLRSQKKNDESTHVDMIYQSNYEAGLGLMQVMDYESVHLKEVAYFDTFPGSDLPTFNGAWSVFPYFPSGLVAISSIAEGLFLVRPDLDAALDISSSPMPSALPTPLPTRSPSTSRPTPSRSGISVNLRCKDADLAFNNIPRKNCDWVGEKQTRKRCRAVWNGKKIKRICKETCGRAGIGRCKKYFKAQDLMR